MIIKIENFIFIYINKHKFFLMYKLYIESDNKEIEENWDIELDFSNLWNDYINKKNDLKDFIIRFKYKVNDYKQYIIDNKNVEVWNELVILLNKLKDYDNNKIFNKLNEVYDWADKNNIKIHIK